MFFCFVFEIKLRMGLNFNYNPPVYENDKNSRPRNERVVFAFFKNNMINSRRQTNIRYIFN